MTDSEPPTICTYCYIPGHNMADCHARARFAATKRVSVTNPIKKRKNNRRGRRGGKAKKAQKAKEAREAKEAKKVMSCRLVAQNHIHVLIMRPISLPWHSVRLRHCVWYLRLGHCPILDLHWRGSYPGGS
ncbi:hypothetical protein ACN38_g10333 [Penicillium nordicum]|uniref:Uncharacterized protein n=1 Tax=Penicillium nordicum TaxID=229535 RepID=A0A0M9WBR7_9EURO|nr:hypothetical protein ACN38_g10333 [Penicillium nordicum]